MRWWALAWGVTVLVAGGCGGGSPSVAPSRVTTTTILPQTPQTPQTEPAAPVSTTTSVAPPAPVHLTIRLERWVGDEATADFAPVVVDTLTDARGWTRADVTFRFDDGGQYRIVLAEGPDVDALCAPYTTGGRFSCQIGPVVALNADRWRTATPQWPGDLDSYRRMLVNHEVGHLLGQHHPDGGCTTAGMPAPVMIQQSTSLGGCLPNPWPLDWEIRCAAARLEPLAPPFEEEASPRCGPAGPIDGGA